MMRLAANRTVIECVKGRIEAQPDVDVIVNAANAALRPGGGVAGAIHRAAGPGLALECRPLAPLRTGEAVLTRGHNLPNRHVIHCLGPVYGQDVPSDQLLADCYRNALRLADENGLRSIAFPAISTGIFGYPAPRAAKTAFETILAEVPQLESIRMIRLVLITESDLHIHEETLQRMTTR